MPELSELSPREFSFGSFSSSPSSTPVFHELHPRALGLKHNIFKLHYKKTFSFKNLHAKIVPIIEKALEDIAAKSASQTKLNLSKLRSPALTPFTKQMRRKGYGWSGAKGEKYKTESTKPLIQTGHLRNNIRFNKGKKSVDMPAYGVIQNKGFTSQIIDRYMNVKYIKVPPRPFIALPNKSNFTSSIQFGDTRPFSLAKTKRKMMSRVRKAFKSGQTRYKSMPS